MAAGDVVCQIVDATTAAVDTAVTALRVTANDKWAMCSLGLQNELIMIVHIEEA